MSDQQLYFPIGVPVAAVLFGMMMNLMVVVWQSRGRGRRLDKIGRTPELITRLKQKTGLD
jgi:hypothetical protein